MYCRKAWTTLERSGKLSVRGVRRISAAALLFFGPCPSVSVSDSTMASSRRCCTVVMPFAFFL